MKIAIYGRVSTQDQNPENQILQLRKLAESLQPESIVEYIDKASGASQDRTAFRQLLQDADRRKFNVLIFWSLDRISREGIHTLFGYIERFKRNGIALKSFQESWLDMTSPGVAELLLAIFGWVAQMERKRISERVKAGLAVARASGKKLGRQKGQKDKKKRRTVGYFLRYSKK